DRQWPAREGTQLFVDVVVAHGHVADAGLLAQEALNGAVAPGPRVLFGVEQIHAACGALRVVVGPNLPEQAREARDERSRLQISFCLLSVFLPSIARVA